MKAAKNELVHVAAEAKGAGTAAEVAEGGEVAAGATDPVAGIVLVGTVLAKYAGSFIAKSDSTAQKTDTQILAVNQTINGTKKTTIFRILTGRELDVDLNGKFQERLSPTEIIITAQPNTNSTIKVTDSASGDQVYKIGGISLRPKWSVGLHLPLGARNSANLDTGADHGVSGSAAELTDLKSGFLGNTLVAVNGTTVVRWPNTNQPDRSDCSSFPPSSWTSLLTAHGTYCVHTSQGRYGVVQVKTAGKLSGYKVRIIYVIWKSPKGH